MNQLAVIVTEAEPGTVFQDGTERFVVSDECAVFIGRHCYVTPKIFARIRASAERAVQPDVGDE